MASATNIFANDTRACNAFKMKALYANSAGRTLFGLGFGAGAGTGSAGAGFSSTQFHFQFN